MIVARSISQPIGSERSPCDSRQGLEADLVAAWECGREKAREDPQLAHRAQLGALVPLPWQGGVTRAPKCPHPHMFGTFEYLAMWQGLRGDDLYIDTEQELERTCALTNVCVTFTTDAASLLGEPEESAEW